MYIAAAFKGKNEKEVLTNLESEGYVATKIHESAGQVYSPQCRRDIRVMVILEGSVSVEIAGHRFEAGPEDEIIIPSHIMHSVKVGPSGCTFYWCEPKI